VTLVFGDTMGLNEVRCSKSFLKLLASCAKIQRKALLETASKEQYYALCEVILNVASGVTELDDAIVEKLKKHRQTIRTWSDRRLGSVAKTVSFVRHQTLIPLLLSDVDKILSDHIYT
jgi:hypothetical protein